jgi:hypothetical protein
MTKIEDEAIKKMPAEEQRAAEGIDRPQVVRKLKEFFTPSRPRSTASSKGAGISEEEAGARGPRAAAVGTQLPRHPTDTHVLTAATRTPREGGARFPLSSVCPTRSPKPDKDAAPAAGEPCWPTGSFARTIR